MHRTSIISVLLAALVLFPSCDTKEGDTADPEGELRPVVSRPSSMGLSLRQDAPGCLVDDTFYQAPPFFYPEQEPWIQERETIPHETGRTACNLLHDVLGTSGSAVRVEGRFVHNCDPGAPLAGEWALVYFWGTGLDGWIHLGRVLTDGQGRVELALPPLPRGRYIIKVVIAGDLSSSNGYISMLDRGAPAVVFDLDDLIGALSPALEAAPGTSPQEALTPDADALVRHHVEQGYEVLLFTRRPFWTATRTRGWLASLELPFQAMHFLSGPETTEQPASAVPVTAWFREVQNRAGLVFHRAYGSALEDIYAFEAVGVPKEETYIIGEHAGERDTAGLTGTEGIARHLEALEVLEGGTCVLGE